MQLVACSVCCLKDLSFAYDDRHPRQFRVWWGFLHPDGSNRPKWAWNIDQNCFPLSVCHDLCQLQVNVWLPMDPWPCKSHTATFCSWLALLAGGLTPRALEQIKSLPHARQRLAPRLCTGKTRSFCSWHSSQSITLSRTCTDKLGGHTGVLVDLCTWYSVLDRALHGLFVLEPMRLQTHEVLEDQ